MLSKPYTRETLARKIRQVLDQRPPGLLPRAETPVLEPKIIMEQTNGKPDGLKVLFVEDEALIRISTADFLQELGMTVIEAGAANEAIELARDQAFDVLVTDVHLPDMSGLDLILALRQSVPDLPVIFATGDRNVEGADNLARSALVTKPYDYDLLATLIRSVVAPSGTA
ncbi:response regulator receiver domain-containing protein [Neorhizobium alkalisoli]|uniref:Response regulator receiver domain-containing protein n=2 Tax=Neorhizobium alkalisoli TaxID=528178 RepID=A0A561QVT9_9HYPH|nr:response regulator receiver domain-containing protein [Neorhizobium alkalisoli]